MPPEKSEGIVPETGFLLSPLGRSSTPLLYKKNHAKIIYMVFFVPETGFLISPLGRSSTPLLYKKTMQKNTWF